MLLTPEYIFKNVEAITPEFLRQLGVTALVLDVDNTLLDFDAAGRYVSLLTGDQLDIYTSDFTPYSSLDQTQNARYISLTDSGAALLANSQQAWLYLPS